MKKTDKKTEKALIAALHKVCNDALDKVEGFEWLTHLVSFSDFPNSLRIVCVFKSNDSLEQARKKNLDHWLCECIQQQLGDIEILLRDIGKHVQFETEENCEIENNGDWNKRLNNTIH
jgi:hypothetical protein